jgi:hypothetical protein
MDTNMILTYFVSIFENYDTLSPKNKCNLFLTYVNVYNRCL